MATGQLTTVLDHLRRAARPDLAGRSDGELLGAFLVRQDAAAFEALLHRHAHMVHGVCRRLLGDAADADDAFQATFLVLVRRAAAVVPRDRVGNWLYGVAYKTALAARRRRARRRAREIQVSQMPHPPAPSDTARLDWQQLLDRELSQLPDKYRLPVVLCDLEGRTRREVARHLRVPEGTLSNRLAAGRQRLAGRLRRRGLALSAAAVAGLLEREAAAQAPAALVAGTVQSALRVAATPAALAALIPPQVTSLTQGVIQTMGLAKLKLTVSLALTLGLLGAGTAWTWQPAPESAAAPPGAKAVSQEDAAKKARARGRELLRDAIKAFNDAADEPRALRHRLLADMAVLKARLGDRPGALKLFDQARDLVAALPDEQQPGELRGLATAEAKAGELDVALATTRRIPAGNQYRDITYQEVATELAKLRREKDALRVCEFIENEKTRGWLRPTLLTDVALAYAQAGDLPQALKVVDRMTDPSAQVAALAGVIYFNLWHSPYPNHPGVALLQADKGDKAAAQKTLARAAELAPTATGAVRRAAALTALACAQARLGDLDAARKNAAGIERAEGKAIAQATIARALAQVGKTKEALAVADGQPDAQAKAFVLIHVGQGQAKAGDRKGALATLSRAHELIGKLGDNERSGQAHNLVSALAAAGDYAAAEAAAAELLGDGNIGSVNVAYIRAEAGDFAGARQMTERYTESAWWQGNLWRGIAKVQTQRGGEKAALAWVSRLDSPLARANALLGVAEGLVERKK